VYSCQRLGAPIPPRVAASPPRVAASPHPCFCCAFCACPLGDSPSSSFGRTRQLRNTTWPLPPRRRPGQLYLCAKH